MMQHLKISTFLCLSVLFFSCSSLNPTNNSPQRKDTPTPKTTKIPIKRYYQQVLREPEVIPYTKKTTKEDFMDNSAQEGSLWPANGETNYFFSQNLVKNSGDTFSLVIENSLYQDILQNLQYHMTALEKKDVLEVMKNILYYKVSKYEPLTEEEKKKFSFEVPEILANQIKSKKSQDDKETLIQGLNFGDFDLGFYLNFKPNDTIIAQVVVRKKNGIIEMKAIKKLQLKFAHPKILTLTGYLKESDFNEDRESFNSQKMMSYEIKFSG